MFEILNQAVQNPAGDVQKKVDAAQFSGSIDIVDQ